MVNFCVAGVKLVENECRDRGYPRTAVLCGNVKYRPRSSDGTLLRNSLRVIVVPISVARTVSTACINITRK